MECSEIGGMNNTDAMMHEKQGIVWGPLRSQVAVWRYSTVGTVTSHVTTGIRQPQTPDVKATTRSPSEDEMSPRVNALYGGVRMAEK